MKKTVYQTLITSPDLRLTKPNFLKPRITRFYYRYCGRKEGHLGASLGVIELTIALHYVLTPQMIY
jgi:1-deoxy-D-xylulose-5-phosphate synthase